MNKRVESEAEKARKGRNIALGLGLVAFVLLVFVVTVVRLGGNVAHRFVASDLPAYFDRFGREAAKRCTRVWGETCPEDESILFGISRCHAQ